MFGYGTAAGAPMVEFVGAAEIVESGDTGYVRDFSADAAGDLAARRRAISSRSPTSSESHTCIAADRALAALASAIADAAPTVSDGSGQTRRHLYWIPALALFAMVLWQAAASVNELLTTRRLFGETNDAERVSA